MPLKTSKKTAPKTTRRASQIDRKQYFDLLGLPTELINQILETLPPLPPPDVPHRVSSLDDVHPCFALCSVSRFLKACYLQIGELPTSIEVTIRPVDYLVEGEANGELAVRTKLGQRLSILGEGQSNIVKLRIVGPDIDLTTSDERLNKTFNLTSDLDSPRAPRRLMPAHKVLLKRHIEEQIIQKQAAVKNLFSSLSQLFRQNKRITEIELQAGNCLPASAWVDVLREYIHNHPQLRKFEFINPVTGRPRARNTHYWGRHWEHIEILEKNGYFTPDERPSNYPKKLASLEWDWHKLCEAITTYMAARGNLNTLALDALTLNPPVATTDHPSTL